MYRSYLRPLYRPPRRRFDLFTGGSRYRPRFSSFLSPWGSNIIRYGNSRRPRHRRRSGFLRRDRRFIPRRSEGEATIPETPEEEEEEPEPELPTEEILKMQHVKDVDFHISKNALAHHTEKYEKTQPRENDDGTKETPELVVRRGQEFFITLKLDRPYNSDRDDLRVVFRIGDRPLPSKGTEVVLRVKELGEAVDFKDTTAWRIYIKSVKDNDVNCAVYPAANCIIGEWDFAVQTVFKKDDGTEVFPEYTEPDNIYIILNPFCKDDGVYMETRQLLDEYILNDQGCQWYGSSRNIGVRDWFFGQFEDGILDVSLSLLRLGFEGKFSRKMSNPIYISRMLSKMVNSADGDSGVLEGKWPAPGVGYPPDSTRPTSWTGSVAILKKYERTGKTVKYGQCWVFSGVLTTVCRAVGLPCRSITNFDSAHDSEDDATIDMHYDRDGKFVSYLSDSIWNFHVWNDVWMQRPDAQGYDGWQALDATPQERSDGAYQCGPCPVASIRKGKINVRFDGTFVFGEVNGTVVKYNADGRITQVDTKRVGQKMSTKVPNGKPLGRRPWGTREHPDRLDCTHLYKPPEGSNEEREVLERVASTVGDRAPSLDFQEDITIHLEDILDVMVGVDFECACDIHNVSVDRLTVDISAIITAEVYNGTDYEVIKEMSLGTETIRSGDDHKLKVPVKAGDYVKYLASCDSLKIEVVVKEKGSGKVYVEEEAVNLVHPEIFLTAKGQFAVGTPFEVLLELTNPLNVALTGLKIQIEGPGLRASGKIIEPKQKTVPANGKLKEMVKLTPKRAGRKLILATLDCEELPDIHGNTEIEVP